MRFSIAVKWLRNLGPALLPTHSIPQRVCFLSCQKIQVQIGKWKLRDQFLVKLGHMRPCLKTKQGSGTMEILCSCTDAGSQHLVRSNPSSWGCYGLLQALHMWSHKPTGRLHIQKINVWKETPFNLTLSKQGPHQTCYFAKYLSRNWWVSLLVVVWVWVLLLWGDTIPTATLIEENVELGLAYCFRGSVSDGGKHGSMQPDKVPGGAESSTPCSKGSRWGLTSKLGRA